MFKNSSKYRWLSTSIWWLVIFVFVYGFITQRNASNNEEIKYDTAIYYHYLPAVFIYHDFTLAKAETLKKERLFFLSDVPNGSKVSKMTMGWAMLNAPAFLLADAWTQAFGLPRSGLEVPYTFAVMLNLLFFAFLGIYFLQKFLAFYFSPLVATFSVALLVLGSNIPYYTLVAPMAHVFGFSLFSIILYYTNLYGTSYKAKHAIILGLLGGLFLVLRPTNVLLLFFPLALFTTIIVKSRMPINLRHVLLLLVCLVCMLLPQLLYWHHMTGNWLVYSYTYESFHFNNPEIIKGLFSFRKGWITYSPIVGFGVIGIVWASIQLKKWALFAVPITLLFLFVTFSWWCWWYGGGFGSRATIEILPIIALGLAYIIFKSYSSLKRYIAIPITICLLAAASLGLFFNWQYKTGLIHWDGMTKEAYKAVFLQTLFPTNYASLIEPPDYAKALENKD